MKLLFTLFFFLMLTEGKKNKLINFFRTGIENCDHDGFLMLTFDDGINEDTERVLDYLQSRKLQATFFIVGKTLDPKNSEYEYNAGLLKRMVREGHIIGSHSWDHSDFVKLFEKSGPDAVRQQLKKTSDAIFKVIGARPKLFRPPYGSIKNHVAHIIEKEFKMMIVFWNLDTKDYESENGEILPLVVGDMEKVLADDSEYFQSFISLQHDVQFDEDVQDALIDEYEKRKLQIVSAWECFSFRKLYYVNDDD